MTFKELYLSGQVPFEEIDRYISRWNRSDDERTLQLDVPVWSGNAEAIGGEL